MVLNVKKTKEFIFNFHVKKTTFKSINLCDLEVERFSSFKLLGIWLDDNLKSNSNTGYIIKKNGSNCIFLKFLKSMGHQARFTTIYYCKFLTIFW